MEKARLGRTGLMVSRLGFGGIPIQRLNEAEAVTLLHRCLDLGINFLDTATAYTTSEGFIGKAIKGRREGLVLATKSTARDPDRLRKHMERSLQSLGTDVIDVYQLHAVDDMESYNIVTAPGGLLDTLNEAREEGKLRYTGLTSHVLEVALKAARSGMFDTVQFPYNFVAREADAGLLPACLDNDIGFIAMKPMGGGFLEDASLAMKFLLQSPYVHPIVGVYTMEQVEELARIVAGDWGLAPEEEQRMKQIAAETDNKYCRHCYYCQPCPQEILICEVMAFPLYLKRSVPSFYMTGWVADNMEKAGACTECAECEPRCPFNLPIREMMRDNAALYQRLKAG